ncbi:uncharacterized protein LOC134944005 [Pseudophryne corroboree]|uniref:uncharacterized protein LOC134944005 n=1 Tax=Pseudophryne corroboree TaxID=495146 RepID=UPI003081C9D3
MNIEVFKGEEFSHLYQDRMFPYSQKVLHLVLSYLEEKKGRPFEVVVDAGCGTGRSTRPLAEHFCEVIGIDISESQIKVARKCTPQRNITYQVASVAKMPLEDASVDLINADVAAHWFPIDEFITEATRVLKNRGCLALHCLYPTFTVKYKNCSETLTNIFNEAFEYLCKFEVKGLTILKSKYQAMFEALPFAGKQRITDIQEMFHLTLAELLGFLKSTCICRIFLTKDKVAAVDFLQSVKKRMVDAMGEISGEEILEFHVTYFCILAYVSESSGSSVYSGKESEIEERGNRGASQRRAAGASGGGRG